MSTDARVNRDLRKQVLLLELESHRLEIAAGMTQLRHPLSALRQGAGVASVVRNKLTLVVSLVALFAGPRLTWLVRIAPLAVAGWRIATLLRSGASPSEAARGIATE